MLHIILLILKIIGIAILVVLGTVLVLLALALLVPVRYRLLGNYYGKAGGDLRLTWLLHSVSVLVTYDGGTDTIVRIFGIRLPKKRKDRTEEDEDEQETAGEPEEEKQPGDAAGGSPEEEVGAGYGSEEEDQTVLAQSADASFSDISGEASSGEVISGEAGGGESSDEGTDISLIPPVGEDEEETETAAPGAGAEDGGNGIFEKIRYLFSSVCDKLKLADRKRRQILELLEDPVNQETIRFVWEKVLALIRHILPVRARGTIRLGFDDPATTGSVLAACSVFYAMYGDGITWIPEFQESVLEGELDLKGRVRLGTVLWLAARVLLNRNFRVMLKKIKKIRANGGMENG